MTKIINGKEISAQLKQELAAQIAEIKKKKKTLLPSEMRYLV